MMLATRTADWAIIGDSLTQGGPGVDWWQALLVAMAPQFGAPTFNGFGPLPTIQGQRAPLLFRNGASGRAWVDISATIGTILAAFPTSVKRVLFALGINDAQRLQAATETLPALQAAATTILTAAIAKYGGPNVGVLGCYALPGNTQLATVDNAVSSILVSLGGQTYITASGLPNSQPTFTVDGVHATWAGAQLLAAQSMAQIQVVP